MAHSSLEQVKKEVSLAIEWRAFELRPAEARPYDEAAMEQKKAQIAAYWPQVEQIARERYGLEIKQGPWGIDTRPAHIAAKVAGDLGEGDAFHLQLFKRYWEKGEDVGRRDVLLDIARSLNFDLRRFQQGLDDPERLAEVLNDERGAAQSGIQGVPAMIVDEKYLVSGAQTKDVLVRALSEYQRQGTMGGQ